MQLLIALLGPDATGDTVCCLAHECLKQHILRYSAPHLGRSCQLCAAWTQWRSCGYHQRWRRLQCEYRDTCRPMKRGQIAITKDQTTVFSDLWSWFSVTKWVIGFVIFKSILLCHTESVIFYSDGSWRPNTLESSRYAGCRQRVVKWLEEFEALTSFLVRCEWKAAVLSLAGSLMEAQGWLMSLGDCSLCWREGQVQVKQYLGSSVKLRKRCETVRVPEWTN